MTSGLACIILDGLGPYTMRQLDMEATQRLYNSDETSAGLLCTSGLAHTPVSNAMIWGHHRNVDKVWVDQPGAQWTGGLDGFNPIHQQADEGIELYTRDDIETNFVWDVLDHRGLSAVAIGIPICLPPYHYNADVRLRDAWFPHTRETLSHHIRMKPRYVEHHAIEGDDFICTSIKCPDQWMHSLSSEAVDIDPDFVESEVPVLEERVGRMIDVLEREGYDWMIFGDHGAPRSGRTAVFSAKNVLFRHRKEAIIIGSTDTVPRYTDEMYPFILDYFGVDDVEEPIDYPPESPPPDDPRENVPLSTSMAVSLID